MIEIRENVLGPVRHGVLRKMALSEGFADYEIEGLRRAQICFSSAVFECFLHMMGWPEPFEIQLTKMGVGDFYGLHRDAQYPVNEEPATTFVYYLAFDCEGGELSFYDGRTITPQADMMVIFDGVSTAHRILPLTDGLRMTINGDYKGEIRLP